MTYKYKRHSRRFAFLAFWLGGITFGSADVLGQVGGAGSDSQLSEEEKVRKVESLADEGTRYFRSKEYERAIGFFQRAYDMFAEPNLLYNIARSYEALGEHEKAIDTYSRFISSAGAHEKLRERAIKKIIELKDAWQKELGIKLPNEPLMPQALKDDSKKASTVTSEGADKSKDIRRLTWSKWSTASIGVALIAGGVLSYGAGQSDYNRVVDAMAVEGSASDLSRREAMNLSDGSQWKRNLGIGLLSAGGAALITSAILFYLDGSVIEKEPGKVRGRPVDLSLDVSSQGATLGLTGRF